MRDIRLLILAQFLTAFADNAVLFIAVGMVKDSAHAGWYVPTLQASFLVAYVALAAWVGPFVDARSKTSVLFGANLIKALGVGLMFAGVEPLLAYAVVGIGSATYSPAKYGILPELAPSDRLVKLNAWVEGSTIVAILSGALAGGMLVDRSVSLALLVALGLYLASAMVARLMRALPAVAAWPTGIVKRFLNTLRELARDHDARYALIGSGLFWSSAAVLRVVVVAWAPLVLGLTSTQDIAELTLWSALGIGVGAMLAPRVIPMTQLSRTRFAAYAMAWAILLLAVVDHLWAARLALLLAGIAGGVFVVPVNAILQAIGHRGLGEGANAGAVVAVQRFVENAMMLIATGGYAALAAVGAQPIGTLYGLCGLLALGVFLLNRGR
ncbi:MAG: lysophospholipid transporter LplT [Gammaproteobacteria bacterium]|nr:lysophospholipid transporter LplT [Gammaproteobacteria bacterium]MCP5137801.1 lysophospholipid transporter LplT [Gammaproteobacteria bacterium]